MLPLTDDDYATLSPLQHERLRSHFPAELQDAALLTRHDATLVVCCDWEAIALLNEAWHDFGTVAYLITGCASTWFYVDGALVLTQGRAIQLQQSVYEATAMVATAERQAKVETMTATTAAVAAKPRRSLNEIVQELAEEIAARAIAKVEASAVMVNHAIQEHQANGLTPEQAPVIEATPETPTKLPTVRLKGIYTPTSSNFVQSAKRYLKAVDPSGDAAKALKEIALQSPIGQAHLERAVKAYPVDLQEKARTKLWTAFSKIYDERNASA